MPRLLLICIVLLLIGCDDTTPIDLPDGRMYYPLSVGSVLEYQSDSIVFDDAQGGNSMDTLRGFIQERYVSKFETSPGDTTYVVERYFRRTDTLPWELTDVYSQAIEQDLAMREENNLIQSKLRFPIRDNSKWDPTAFIDPFTEVLVGTELIEMFTNWQGATVSLAEPAEIGPFSFDDVAHVQLADDDNEIERRFVHEVYAADVGLVLKIDTILDSRCKRLGDLLPCLEDNGDGELVSQPWSVKAEKGYILRQEITAIR